MINASSVARPDLVLSLATIRNTIAIVTRQSIDTETRRAISPAGRSATMAAERNDTVTE
jgi:hypothetical protein